MCWWIWNAIVFVTKLKFAIFVKLCNKKRTKINKKIYVALVSLTCEQFGIPMDVCELGEIELPMLLTTEPEDALPPEVLFPSPLLQGFPSLTRTGTATRRGELCPNNQTTKLVFIDFPFPSRQSQSKPLWWVVLCLRHIFILFLSYDTFDLDQLWAMDR